MACMSHIVDKTDVYATLKYCLYFTFFGCNYENNIITSRFWMHLLHNVTQTKARQKRMEQWKEALLPQSDRGTTQLKFCQLQHS